MTDNRSREEAALWMARARDPHFTDWDELTHWLEADPANNVAYEQAFAGHDEAALLGSEVATALMGRRSLPLRRGRMIWGAGIAVALSAIAYLAVPWPARTHETVVETQAGEQRTVALDDGSSVELAGASRLIVIDASARAVRLEHGEAMFNVVHQAERPFTVDVGGERLVDVGTRFDVLRADRMSEISVAQGAVLFDPEGAAVQLGAGRTLHKGDGSRLVEVSDVAPTDVGSWRSGRLTYKGVELSRVAEDLARLTGAQLHVSPEAAKLVFTGVIVVPHGDRRAFLDRLGPLLGVDVVADSKGYDLTPRAGR